MLGPEPFGVDGAAAALQARPDRMDLGRAYLASVSYALTHLTGYLETQAPADLVLIVIGDHQPQASVSGPDAPWDVPVHVIAGWPKITQALLGEGFQASLAPTRPAIGPMHALGAQLLRAFKGDPAPASDAKARDARHGPP